MMKIYKTVLIFLAGALIFAACEDSLGPELNPDAEPPAFQSPSSGDRIPLLEEEAGEEVLVFNWTAPDFGFPAAVDYRVEMGSPDGDFENPVNIGTTSTTSLNITTEQINGALLNFGLIPGEESSVLFRIRATVAETVDPLYSDPVELLFTPYEMDVGPAFPEQLFMIGNSVGDWDWGNTDLEMIPVATKPHLFWKIVWIDADVEDPGYKFAPEKGGGTDFGYDGEPAVDGVVGFGGDNMPSPEETGYYMVVVNLETEQIAVAEPRVYLIGGTVGGWDMEMPDALFTADHDNQVMTITRELMADELRIYAWYEGDWFTDWWQSEFMIFDGQIEYRGAGDDQERVLPSADGEYTIELDFRNDEGSIK